MNKNGGSICPQRTSKMLTGIALSVISATLIGCLSPLSAESYESGKFPGKGSKQAWTRSTVPYNEGVDLAAAKKWDAAISKYQEANAMYPFSDGHFYNLGVAYEKRAKPGDLAKSEAAYRKATDLCATDWRNWNALANVVGDQERYRECRDLLKKAADCNPPAQKLAGITKQIKNLDNYLLSQR